MVVKDVLIRGFLRLYDVNLDEVRLEVPQDFDTFNDFFVRELRDGARNIDPDPEKIKLGMPVEVVYKDALGRKDRQGNSYVSYFFQPRS